MSKREYILITPTEGEVTVTPEGWCDATEEHLWSIEGVLTPTDLIALGRWLQRREAQMAGNVFDDTARSLFEASQGMYAIKEVDEEET